MKQLRGNVPSVIQLVFECFFIFPIYSLIVGSRSSPDAVLFVYRKKSVYKVLYITVHNFRVAFTKNPLVHCCRKNVSLETFIFIVQLLIDMPHIHTAVHTRHRKKLWAKYFFINARSISCWTSAHSFSLSRHSQCTQLSVCIL